MSRRALVGGEHKQQQAAFDEVTARHHAWCEAVNAKEPDKDEVAEAEEDLADAQRHYAEDFGGVGAEPDDEDA